MKTISKALAKTTVATAAAGAMAFSAMTPAVARDRDGDISVGDVIAGAVVLGGIAAVASAASRNSRDGYGYGNRDYNYDRGGYRDEYRSGRDYGYRNGNPRQAIEQCVRAAERDAGRYGRGADVTDIRDVRNTRYGYEVRGRIAVNTMGRDWRRGDDNYGRGWGNDYRGWTDRMRGYDSGKFTCRVENGRVVDLDYSGLSGWR